MKFRHQAKKLHWKKTPRKKSFCLLGGSIRFSRLKKDKYKVLQVFFLIPKSISRYQHEYKVLLGVTLLGIYICRRFKCQTKKKKKKGEKSRLLFSHSSFSLHRLGSITTLFWIPAAQLYFHKKRGNISEVSAPTGHNDDRIWINRGKTFWHIDGKHHVEYE
jgi:hypothetical protein